MRHKLNPEERQRRRKRFVQRSKFALPSAITLISVLCGFSSVVISINATNIPDKTNYFLWAATLIILAALFDGIDGRVARATKTTSEFGVQLDSLADVLSFGMAPAILAYVYGFMEIGQTDSHARAVGWAASFFFLACGALRLARFNIQAERTDPRFFVGMPIPLGAVCIASVILKWPTQIESTMMAYIFSGELFLVGLLMISTLSFPSFKKRSHHPKATTWITVSFLALLCLLVILKATFFIWFFATYTVLSLAMNLGWHFGWKGIHPPPSTKAQKPSPHQQQNIDEFTSDDLQ
ncbi:MAG: CDP-diacylglycerol--serine O-phosphatidyltransferase [Holophagaceae bacterium]|nr:CDP-diacylglycerol--serine O-phosphatidyltransferase [Holophagaceae bacterium]